MGIRKTGSVTGQVTGVDGQDTLQGHGSVIAGAAWSDDDDQGLAAENEAADAGDA